jgi:hypothetical protein
MALLTYASPSAPALGDRLVWPEAAEPINSIIRRKKKFNKKKNRVKFTDGFL